MICVAAVVRTIHAARSSGAVFCLRLLTWRGDCDASRRRDTTITYLKLENVCISVFMEYPYLVAQIVPVPVRRDRRLGAMP